MGLCVGYFAAFPLFFLLEFEHLPMCVCTSVIVHDGFEITAADYLAFE